MKKNKLYIFILIIMVTASCLFLGGCVSKEQIDKFAEKYPGAFRFAVVAYIAQSAKQAEFGDFEFDEGEDGPYTKEGIKAKKREINDEYNEKLLEALLTKEDGSDSDQASQDSLKTTETTALQAKEDTQTTEEEKPTGTITLKIDWSGIPGEMIIDFDTGAVTGSYDYEGEVATAVGSFNGSIDISTNIIAASGSETFTGNLTGNVTTSSISLKGTLSPDYKSAEGTITNDEGEFPWTGTAQ